MKNSKLVQFLSLFSTKELKKVQKFIYSAYFNNENKVKELFSYIISTKNEKLDREIAFKHLYPTEKFDIRKFNYLSTQLFNLLKKYVEIEYQSNNDNIYNPSVLHKLRSLNLRHLYQLEEKLILRKSAQKQANKSIDYQHQYLFEYERLNFYAERKRTETQYIKNLHFNLDAYYLIEKLKIACTTTNQQKLYKTEAEEDFTEILINYIDKTKFQEQIPLLNVYYNTYKMLQKDDAKHFAKLKNELYKNDFAIDEIKDAFLFGLNFCIQKMNKGDSDFNNEVFEMYQRGIDQSILLKNGNLSPIIFSNIVTIGLRLKKYDKVESFIKEKFQILAGKEKQSYFSFNMAKVYFEKGDFGKVTDLYNEKMIKEILLNIQMRILQIKAFYELGEIETCQSLLTSTDQILNRKGILAYHKTVFKNFIKNCKQLILVNQFDKKAKHELKTSFTENKQLIDKAWLVAKLENRKAKH